MAPRFVRVALRAVEPPDVPLARLHLGADPRVEERRPWLRALFVALLVVLPFPVIGALFKCVAYAPLEVRLGFARVRLLLVPPNRVPDQGVRR